MCIENGIADDFYLLTEDSDLNNTDFSGEFEKFFLFNLDLLYISLLLNSTRKLVGFISFPIL